MLYLAVFIIVITYLLIKYVNTILFVNKFPNPGIPLPVIGNSLIFRGPPEDMYHVLKRICRKDPEMRKLAGMLGPEKTIMLFHPETSEKVLSSNVNINKSINYEPLLPWLGRGLLINYGQPWRQKRKLLTPAFHFKILEDSMPIFNKNADILADILLADGKHGKEAFDYFPFVTRCTLDIILESAMGKKLNVQQNRHSQYGASICGMVSLIQHIQKSPWIWPKFIFAWTKSKQLQDKYLDVLHGFTKSVIRERKLERDTEGVNPTNSRRKAFLDLLMNVKTSTGEYLTDAELQEEVDTFMFEGHDTTACALSWTLLLIANHPEVQEKILQEQDEIFEGSSEMDVTQEDLTKMKYLECCIKEALRLYPSVPIMARRVDKEFEVDGVVIPKDSTAIIFTMMQHRNPKVWENPDDFIPERFMGEKSYHPYAYIPFSAGPRNCIGMRFALMEEKTVLSKLLRRVKITKKDSIQDVQLLLEVITRPKDGIRAYFEER